MIKKGRKIEKILKINVDSTLKGRVLSSVRVKMTKFTKSNRKYNTFTITTPNPEIILEAQIDQNLTNILNNSDFCIPDGIGIAQANKFYKLRCTRNRVVLPIQLIFQGVYVGLRSIADSKWLYRNFRVIKGRVLMLDLIRLANKMKWKIFLLGGVGQVAERSAEEIQKNYKKVKVAGFTAPTFDNKGMAIDKKSLKKEEELIKNINSIRPHLLFVGFGCPKQEKWISRNINKLDVGGVMAVGGSFDYLAGRVKLPPTKISNIGFEWLWRLVVQPTRFLRIINAVIVFPAHVYIDKWRRQS